MRRIVIVLCAAFWLATPAISHAQYNDNDQQNPKEYHDEDSQPLSLIADIFYPIGYAAEWLVSRPMHYLSHDSPAAPAFRPVGGNDNAPPPPVPIIPDNTMDQASSTPSGPQDWSPTRAPITTNAAVIKQSSPQGLPAAAPSTSSPSSQPALH